MHWWGRRWVQRDDSTAWKATQRVSQDCREDAGLRGWSRRPSLDVPTAGSKWPGRVTPTPPGSYAWLSSSVSSASKFRYGDSCPIATSW